MSEEAKELIAFMRSNTSFFYGDFVPTVTKLKQKYRGRDYDHVKEMRTTWKQLTHKAAADYVKQFSSGPISETFSPKVLKEVARELAHEFLNHIFE